MVSGSNNLRGEVVGLFADESLCGCCVLQIAKKLRRNAVGQHLYVGKLQGDCPSSRENVATDTSSICCNIRSHAAALFEVFICVMKPYRISIQTAVSSTHCFGGW